jgi:hypothetical protein
VVPAQVPGDAAAGAVPPEPDRFDELESPRSSDGTNRESRFARGASVTRPTQLTQPTPPSPPQRAPSPTIGGGAPPATLFDRFRTKALETDRSRFASLDGTTLVGIEGNTIRIGAPAAFHAERLRQRIAELEGLATELFGQPTRITVEIAAARAAREESHDSREKSRKQRQEALNSEAVNLAIEVLNAEIVEIRPLGENR